MHSYKLLFALTAFLTLLSVNCTLVSRICSSLSPSRQPSWCRQRAQSRADRRTRNEERRHRKPHIIYIMADDLGWNDVGFHNELVNTPNIDWLARSGIELTDYHSEPICSPSRAALLTGKYSSTTGMQREVVQVRSKQCLPPTLKLLPEMMRENGYTTKMVGKWHLGSCNVSCLPTRRGFDEFKGYLEGAANYLTWEIAGQVSRFVNEQPDVTNIGTHLTTQHQRDVEEMIMAHRNVDTPLFMYIAPLAPHDPLIVTDEMFNRHSFLNATVEQQAQRRRYLGLVAAVDDLVGATISALRRADLYRDSVIVFTSDNGGQAAEMDFLDFVSFGNNYPLRGSKGELYEGGHRVPAVYHSPRLPLRVRGTKRNFLMHITDWLPTFVQMANSSYRLDDLDIDGMSQVSNLQVSNCKDPYRVRDRHLVFLTNFTLQSEDGCSQVDAGFRWRQWKLIYGSAAGINVINPNERGIWIKPIESPNSPDITGDSCEKINKNGQPFVGCLFNLKDDPHEQRDLYNAHPDIVRRLKREIELAKSESTTALFRFGLPISPDTTSNVNGVVVARTGFCNHSTDSLLRPEDTSCPV